MSDNYDGPQMAQKILRQQSEIKQLRERVSKMIPGVYSTDALLNSIKTLEEEVERLRADRDSWADQADARVKDCVEYIAERDKLRALLSLWIDMIRLFREGKPVPIDYIEKQIQEALQDSKAQKICNWTEEGGDYWETDCGNSFCFIDGGPSHNNMVFCPYCGSKLVEIPEKKEEEDEDS